MTCSAFAPDQMTSRREEWNAQLCNLFELFSKHSIALVGVGNPFRGDDYVGSFILKKLMEKSKFLRHIHLYDVEDRIEYFISKLAEVKPRCVIFIDACEMNLLPGETRLVRMKDTKYAFHATHGIPLKLLCEYMLPESDPWLLAIQPEHVEFNRTLSPEIRRTASMIFKVISKEINN